MAKNEDKIVSPTSRQMAVATAEDFYGLYIEGIFFGTMNDEFNPEFQVEWDSEGMADLLGSLAPGGKADTSDAPDKKTGGLVGAIMSKADAGAKVAGIRSGKGFGIMARKLFDHATYWSWSANVTLVDWDGTGLVWQRWEQLKEMALPHSYVQGGAGAAIANAGIAAAIQGAVSSGTIAGAIKGGLTGVALAGGALAFSDLTGLIDEEALQGALQRSTVKAPNPVHIRIGRYGQTQGASPVASMRMVIDSFGASFSKEMTDNGPVAATFTISMSSIEPMTAEAVPVGGSRVTIVQ